MRTVRRALRAAVVAVLAVGSSVFFQPAANASVKTILGNRNAEAWYWASNQDVRACTPSAIPPPVPGLCPSENLSTASPITPGHLPVSWKAGTSDMRAYMMFDLSFIPTGSEVNSMVVTLTVSQTDASDTEHTQEHAATGAKPPATSNASAALIKACLVTVPWGAAEGAPPQDRDPNNPTNTVPTDPFLRNGIDMNTCVGGKPGAKTWTFDITPMAAKWVSGSVFNNGFALLPNGGQTDVWTVEFHGAYYTNAVANPATGGTTDQTFVSHKEEARARIDYVPAVQAPLSVPAPIVVPPVVGGGTTGGGVVSVPPSVPTTVPVPSTTPTTQQSLPVAQTGPRTPWYEWLVLPAGVLGFLMLSGAIGRDAGGGAANRVAETLRQRRAAASTGD